MTPLKKQLFYKLRFARLYSKYTAGKMSWNDYFIALHDLNKRYEEEAHK